MIVDTEIREILIELRNMLETGVDNCFGIMALCKNCFNKCDKQKNREKVKKKIDKILEVK